MLWLHANRGSLDAPSLSEFMSNAEQLTGCKLFCIHAHAERMLSLATPLLGLSVEPLIHTTYA